MLLRELQWRARRTAFERAQVPRLRNFLLKIAVCVRATVRRVFRPRADNQEAGGLMEAGQRKRSARRCVWS